MNPAIVIPSYWAETDRFGSFGERGSYDYATPLTKPLPELETCLDSLERVRGVLRVIVLVVAAPSCAAAARARVTSICRSHPALNPLVVGEEEASLVTNAVLRASPRLDAEAISLRGYGAIRNMGLAVCAALNHDVAVFIDDDEVAIDDDFLLDAVWGLDNYTKQDLPVLAKSGYYVNAEGSAFASEERRRWSEKYWSKRKDFNRLMERNLTSPKRLLRSNTLCGGCCAIHARAFTKVPFDPFITRGEDLDYLLDLRAAGLDVWFDSQWSLRLQPPEADRPDDASRFLQDVYRWLYENQKLKAMNARRNLRTVTASSLKPYPASWLDDSVSERIWRTALRRVVTGPQRGAYLRVLLRGRAEAAAWASAQAKSYLSFAQVWPTIMEALWDEEYLADMLVRTGSVAEQEGA